MTSRVPWKANSPASDLRVSVKAGWSGWTRPGLMVSAPSGATWTGVVAGPPGRSTKDSPMSVRNRKPTRMLPPGDPRQPRRADAASR
jgi:hypothetical protein